MENRSLNLLVLSELENTVSLIMVSFFLGSFLLADYKVFFSLLDPTQNLLSYFFVPPSQLLFMHWHGLDCVCLIFLLVYFSRLELFYLFHSILLMRSSQASFCLLPCIYKRIVVMCFTLFSLFRLHDTHFSCQRLKEFYRVHCPGSTLTPLFFCHLQL